MQPDCARSVKSALYLSTLPHTAYAHTAPNNTQTNPSFIMIQLTRHRRVRTMRVGTRAVPQAHRAAGGCMSAQCRAMACRSVPTRLLHRAAIPAAERRVCKACYTFLLRHFNLSAIHDSQHTNCGQRCWDRVLTFQVVWKREQVAAALQRSRQQLAPAMRLYIENTICPSQKRQRAVSAPPPRKRPRRGKRRVPPPAAPVAPPAPPPPAAPPPAPPAPPSPPAPAAPPPAPPMGSPSPLWESLGFLGPTVWACVHPPVDSGREPVMEAATARLLLDVMRLHKRVPTAAARRTIEQAACADFVSTTAVMEEADM